MDAESLYPSRWLKAADVGTTKQKVRIAEVNPITVKEGQPQKLEVKFSEFDKGVVLNKTNAEALMKVFGKETGGWVDKIVEIFTVYVNFRGENVPSIRLEPVKEEVNS